MTEKRGGAGRNQGRKPLSQAEETITACFRMTRSERDKLAILGGAKWIRNQIANKTCDNNNVIIMLSEAEKHFRNEADFNRSWADGRRGSDMTKSDKYIALRVESANQLENFANAIEFAIASLSDKKPEKV